jgi:hypothetical protein
MEFFNFVETFFFISLAITFVLIMMLVYHFKERISVLEKKTDLMFEIFNNVLKEVNFIKNKLATNNPISNIPVSNIPISNIFSQNNKIIVSDNDDDLDDGENDDDQTEDDQTDVESDVDSDDDNNDDNNDDSIKRINIDFSQKDVIEDINFEEIENNSENINENNEEKPKESLLTNESIVESYRKMDINTLKELVITKGLLNDTKKMKKIELIRLLEQNI